MHRPYRYQCDACGAETARFSRSLGGTATAKKKKPAAPQQQQPGVLPQVAAAAATATDKAKGAGGDCPASRTGARGTTA